MTAARAAVLPLLLLAAAGCGLRGQIGDLVAFATSDFRLRTVDDARLAGVDVRDVRRPGDLGLDDVARMALTAATGEFPLELQLTLESENQSDAPATIRQFDWKLRLDDVEVAAGESPETISLPARGTEPFPFAVRADLRRLIREQSRDAIADLAVGLFDPDRRQARLVLAIRPTFEVFGRNRRTPTYIDVPIRVPRVVSIEDTRVRRGAPTP